MKHVLDAVDDHWPVRVLGKLHDPLDPQELGPVRRPQQIEKHLQGRRGNRPFGRKGKGPDSLAVPVDIMPMVMIMVMTVIVAMMVIMAVGVSMRMRVGVPGRMPMCMVVPVTGVGIGFFVQPRRHVRYLALWIVKAGIEQLVRLGIAGLRIQPQCSGIQRLKAVR